MKVENWVTPGCMSWVPGVSCRGLDLWRGANPTWEGPVLPHNASLSLPSTAATIVISEYLPSTVVQTQQGRRHRREEMMSG